MTKLLLPQVEAEEKARVRTNRFCLLFPPSFWLLAFLGGAVLQNVLLPLFLVLLLSVIPALLTAINSSSQRRSKEAAISYIFGWVLFLCPLAQVFFE